MSRTRRRAAGALALAAALLLPPAAAVASEDGSRRAPRVLLTDFGPEDRPSDTLVQALRAFETRRRDVADARDASAAPDDGWALEILEQARVLDG